jgi:uncharacterized membrane protein YfcA
MFIAVFTQSLSGFGVALVAMALLPGFLDIRAATPLIALVALTMEVMLLNRYRSEVNWRVIRPMIFSAILGIPPMILYGNCRRWPPAEFKGNLQGFFLLTDSVVIMGHALSRNLTVKVWKNYVWTLP